MTAEPDFAGSWQQPAPYGPPAGYYPPPQQYAAPAFEPIMATPQYAAAFAHYSQQMPYHHAVERSKQEAQKALRPDFYAVIAWTLLLGILGAFSASRRASKARAIGLPTTPYWTAFLVTFGVELVAWFALVGGNA
jgi:hypothetical protein